MQAQKLHRAPLGQAEAGHHLVGNQQGPVLAGQAVQGLEERGRGDEHPRVAHHRLEDHRGNLLAVALEEVFEGLGLVVVGHQGQLGEGLGHPGARGGAAGAAPAPGEEARAGLHQEAVGMAVVVAPELHDQVAPGVAPGQP